jgi:PAS domain S-box-containing protein
MVQAWAAAVILPAAATVVTGHLPMLERIPAALFFASIAVTASFGYALPTAAAVALSLALYNYFLAPPLWHWSLQPDELAREAVVLAVAALIGFLNVRLRKTEEALAASEAFYRTTLASIGDAVIATDSDGAATFMNPVAEALTGWTEREAKGKPLSSFFRITDEVTATPVESPVEKVRRLGTVVGMANHTQLERRDGSLIPIDDSAAPIQTAQGRQAGIVLVFRDASDHRLAERQREALLARASAAENELRETISLYEDQVKALGLAQQAAKCAAWVLDVEKRQVKFLPGGFEVFGIPFADLGDREPILFIEAEDRPHVEDCLKNTMTTGAPFTPEFRLRWPNGEMHWQESRGVLDAQNPQLIRGTTFDITERKHAEMSLLRAEKLAAVGRIASTIAHEINNPLASVTNLLYLTLLDPSLGDQARGYLRSAEEELCRLSNVTRLTLSYVRPQNQAREIDPADVIESVLTLFHVRLEAKNIRVERLSPTPFRIRIYVDELQRIVTNLLANAIDAVGLSGGIIRIALARREALAAIAIEDNGVGIPEHRADRIFDPFFTTKEEVGTGIGLWVTKELVEKNGGTICFRSGPLEHGMRTRFELRFPIAAP